MVESTVRRNVCASGLACIALLTGCTPDRSVHTQAATPVLAPGVAPAAAPSVTLHDLDAAQQAVRADPHNSGAYVRLGESCLALGKVEEGAGALREAARLAPRSEPPFVALARLYRDTGYLDRECDVLLHLVALRTHDPKVYLDLGKLYTHLDWLAQARPMLEKALKLAPDLAAAQL